MTGQPVQYIELTPRDPLIARDGRPFSAGMRMRSLDWLYPSVLAGSFRTLIGAQSAGRFSDGNITKLLECSVAGPFPCLPDENGKSELYFPAPSDVAVRKADHGKSELFAARPVTLGHDDGCDFVRDDLQPVLLPQMQEDFKPEPIPEFWSAANMTKWLCEPDFDGQGRSTLFQQPFEEWPAGFRGSPAKDERMHVQIKYDSGAADEGMLFKTIGLDLHELPEPNARKGGSQKNGDRVGLTMSSRVGPHLDFSEVAQRLNHYSPLGGERRLVHWKACPSQTPFGWSCPVDVANAIRTAARIRMVLATPAIFENGWFPDWVDNGAIPETDVKVRLIGACVERWQPISGWSYKERGPKAVRRLVPAGSVYFFEYVSGDRSKIADAWLQSVCHKQDRIDGFGLALWGVWNRTPEMGRMRAGE